MAHGGFLRQHSDDPQLASQLTHDYTKADLDPQTRAMLDFAVKLTGDPSSMQESNVQELRGLELSDEQILSVVLITCNFNFMTRLADGLGVEPAAGRQEALEQWLIGPAKDQQWLMHSKGRPPQFSPN